MKRRPDSGSLSVVIYISLPRLTSSYFNLHHLTLPYLTHPTLRDLINGTSCTPLAKHNAYRQSNRMEASTRGRQGIIYLPIRRGVINLTLPRLTSSYFTLPQQRHIIDEYQSKDGCAS